MATDHNRTTCIGILALQGDFQAHSEAVSRLSVPARLVRRRTDLEEIAGLILPGGESSALLKLLDSEGLWEPLRRFAETHPLFGTCAGAILMADRVENPSQPSLGLIRMTVRRNAYGRQLASSIRRAEVSEELDPAAGARTTMEAVLIRAPIITEWSSEVLVLAKIENQPVAVRQGIHLAATFHPELTSDTRLHEYFLHLVAARLSKIDSLR